MNAELFYCTPFFIASLSVLALALYTFRHRHTRSATYLIMVCFFGAFWAASEGMLYLGFDIETNMLITCLQYLGVSPLVHLTLVFTLSFFGFEAWLTRSNMFLLASLAAAIIVTVWTNPFHQMVYTGYYLIATGPVPMLGLDHGPVWWVILGYHYALTALMSIILLSRLFTSSGIQRCQASVIFIAVCVVWVVNAVYVTGYSPIPNMDIGPLAFILVALSMGWGVFRYQLLDILPIAKSEIFKALSNPILVIDTKKRILDVNPAAGKLFNLSPPEAVGRNIDHLFKDHRKLTELFGETQPQIQEVCFRVNGGQRFFDLRISNYTDKRGTIIGRIIFFHESTERKRADHAQRESERMRGVLEMAGAVSLDLGPPIKALFEAANQILDGMPAEHPAYPKTLKLAEQTRRLKEKNRRLMSITRYETRGYLNKTIVDIDKASTLSETKESIAV